MNSNILAHYTKNWKASTLKALAVPAALAGAFTNADAQNLDFSHFKVNEAKNPFTKIANSIGQSFFQFSYADVDGDGNKDLITGGSYVGKITFLKNIGTNANPLFSKITGAANPFDQIDISNEGYGIKTILADFDGDGKLEGIAVRVTDDEKPVFLKNTGSNASPSFVEMAGTASPFDSFENSNNYMGIAVADIDADGKLDVLATINQYRNNT
ncbi:MAG: FG-GAP repeat domain-containing protein, partial [Cytophagales bacterium]